MPTSAHLLKPLLVQDGDCLLYTSFMDLDGFKAVNDNYGHAFGDLLLVRVAERISAHLRGNDTAVRFGGDEFAVLLDSVKSVDHIRTCLLYTSGGVRDEGALGLEGCFQPIEKAVDRVAEQLQFVVRAAQ